jgi:hypothetical protein
MEPATLKAGIGQAIGERPMPGVGYELFWDGKPVNGPEAVSYSRQEARDNCAWNTRTYPRLPGSASRAFAMANRLRSHPLFKHREIDALDQAHQGDREKVTMLAATALLQAMPKPGADQTR